MKYSVKGILLLVFSVAVLPAVSQSTGNISRERSFDDNWRFMHDSIGGAEQPGFDDSKWRILDLPHDWSIEDLPKQDSAKTIGPFSKESPGSMSTGHTMGGTGWYRKTFTLSAAETGKLISVYFEGAYMETDVWINGHHLGTHPYGYTSFFYNITKYCNPPNQSSIIAVRVVNRGKNSRWYSGSGIYRHVKLISTNPLHIDQWGVFITSPEVTDEAATVNVQTTLINATHKQEAIKVHTTLFDAAGKQVASAESMRAIHANGKEEVLQNIEVKNPKLWSFDAPTLYRAEVAIISHGKIRDVTTSFFGIRSLSFSATSGFLLNNKPVELKGGCMHHDNGILGAAAIDRAEERKVELLKANGFNAVRCSHNPPSEKFLEACDRLGMLVIDEAFDMWQKPKNKDDYHLFFDEWWENDFSSMVLRDRNHPSVILWSIGNEIEERGDTSGLVITNKLKAKANELDPTRLITEAVCEFWEHPGRPWERTAPAFALLDVGGYNYQWRQYENDHKNFPARIMMGTESVPKEAFQNWNMVEKHPYVIGDFVWTAMDYLGESGIGHTTCADEKGNQLQPWPWFNAYCGDIDLIGNKKPQSYYRDVVWRRSKIEMAVHAPLQDSCKESVSYWGWPDEQQSWTWPGNENKMMQVNVYSWSSNVRLMLNNKIIGEIAPDSLLTATFKLPYEPGELKAIAIKDGKEVGNVLLTTSGGAKSLRLIADRTTIHASRSDLSYITVEVVDEKGNVVPNANIPVEFSISGNGELAAVGNANPSDMASFKQQRCKTYRGKCLVILRPTGKEGDIVLEAKTNGLPSARVVVSAKK